MDSGQSDIYWMLDNEIGLQKKVCHHAVSNGMSSVSNITRKWILLMSWGDMTMPWVDMTLTHSTRGVQCNDRITVNNQIWQTSLVLTLVAEWQPHHFIWNCIIVSPTLRQKILLLTRSFNHCSACTLVVDYNGINHEQQYFNVNTLYLTLGRIWKSSRRFGFLSRSHVLPYAHSKLVDIYQ